MFVNRSVGVNTVCSDGQTLNKSNSPALSTSKPKEIAICQVAEVKARRGNGKGKPFNMVVGQEAPKARNDDSESETTTARVL